MNADGIKGLEQIVSSADPYLFIRHRRAAAKKANGPANSARSLQFKER